jgi:group I intron endonuclease
MIKCNTSNKVYIGKAVDSKLRIRSHLNLLDAGCHQNKMLQSDFKSYGRGDFSIEVIERNSSPDREIFYIKEYSKTNTLYNTAHNPIKKERPPTLRSKYKPIQTRLTPELYEEVEYHSDIHGRSVSKEIEQLIKEALGYRLEGSHKFAKPKKK